MRKGIHVVNLKKVTTNICNRTELYSIFHNSSYRMPEIQNDWPKITKAKKSYRVMVLTKLLPTIFTKFIGSCFNNFQLHFY